MLQRNNTWTGMLTVNKPNNLQSTWVQWTSRCLQMAILKLKEPKKTYKKTLECDSLA